MSRVGKNPIPLPEKVSVSVDGAVLSARGPLGSLSYSVPANVDVDVKDGAVVVAPKNNDKKGRMLWGTARSLISNIVHGVSQGFQVTLEITGVGYRAAMQGSDLALNLGFSHDVVFKAPEGITLACPKPTEIVIKGVDKQLVGRVAAKIRGYRPPEPYKGKGVRYQGEYIHRKEGKKK